MPAHKTTDGRWRVWLDLGADPASGRRIRKKVEAKTKREAERKAAALRERFQRGENITDKPRTLGELLDDWMATIERLDKSVNTVTAYRGAIKNQLKPALGAALVPKLRMREIQRVFNTFADNLAPTYIRVIKTVLVQALDFAIEQDERTDNPAQKVRIPSVKQKPGRSFAPEETRALLIACESHRYGLAIRLALMGLRRSEIPGLMWNDFDEQASTMRIGRQLQRINKRWTAVTPKDDSYRTLTLGPKMIAALQLYRRAQLVEQQAMGWQDGGYIFISVKSGGVCPPTTIYKAFCEIAKRAGVDSTRLHDCRHTAATTLLAEGEGIATVAEVLGHASPQITATVYAHALPHKVANASQRLEDLYDDTSGQPQTETRRRHG